MTQTPIYEEVRRALGRGDRDFARRAFREDVPAGAEERPARPVMLRGTGGRHRRSGD
ncbi:hypothetical protein [Actinomycetospora cinnamomea]|uniref:Uncharacterized protein n=1 Tax=Actinomycetospora cinnamomea TaxID=663609 RepID=A0A2U1FLS5_9PSEU|nr:hypothetical protein [Actinomycetospora cinnamomea]PVZ12980.1 hypothetical protein C8D89_102128 [Actinomycetospora cinnamomea]